MNELSKAIKEFVVENFLFGESNGLEGNTSFLDEGVIDSTGILELITHIEETYGVEVEDTELIPENFDSIDNVVAFLERKM